MKRIVFSFLFAFFLCQTACLFCKETSQKVTVYFFWGKGCSHCSNEKIFLKKLKKRLLNIEVISYEIWENEQNLLLLKKISKKMDIDVSAIPVTIIANKYFIGFSDEKTTGRDIEKAIIEAQENCSPDLIKELVLENEINSSKDKKGEYDTPKTLSIPFFGQIEIKNISLPLLTILFGAIDGFNPCAMWVLVMLISFLMGLQNRKKMLILGSLFIFVSALVYFMFMVAWLNFLQFFAYIQWIKVTVGLVAIIGGGYYLKEFWSNKDGTCKITNSKQKKYIASKLENLSNKNQLFLAAIGIILLAFSVNLIELICSAGLPVIYIQILSINALSTTQYYLYILLYIFIFMLDDLLIFFIAIFSLHMVKLTGKYTRFSHLIGGIVLLIIGSLLIFKPEWLMFG
jgi:thiol-disulfide isomerase/thioredoxin/glutaredoxin-related protein